MSDWRVLVCTNDRATLDANLRASDDLRRNPENLLVAENPQSASIGANDLLSRSTGKYSIIAHQDVYLPKNWVGTLLDTIGRIERTDRDWGVLGVYGVQPDGAHAGRVWSSGLGREVGAPFDAPVAVGSLDELLLVVNMAAELRFDEALPGFHLYGTDIVQIARAAGKSAYVIHAPVVHNSVPVVSLSGAYMTAYRYMARKWRAHLPIHTAVATIRRPVLLQVARNIRRSGLRRDRGYQARVAAFDEFRKDPASLARRLGYE